ncbi:MAG: hypothetical protein UR68_C0035G0022 [Candidatus Roizmanbacteria bacterium GW2011_GWA2_35_19]|uniref:Cyclodipeptide synthase n=1 Tax=Candidatus Roizmanbacteria bacterium GW2011_GWA2_35_19 TaxID=1618478 RepID=A0A0G0EWK8_9BACT|nr:MAG: hypothetical protein UR68_C0035G0022 [Candidatus Roizmanbacteria bacterium GW2011_GWA2_35_19]
MRIAEGLNFNPEILKQKQYNIFIGLSLGNRYFRDPNNIKDFLSWSLENSVSNVVIFIPDKIHAINYQVKDKYKPEMALRTALRKGRQMKEQVKEISQQFDPLLSKRIKILTWEEIEKTEDYQRRKKILYEEFAKNPLFRTRIIETVQENTKNTKSQLFTLYPGIGKIDYLAKDIQDGIVFPELSNKLNIQGKTTIIESYKD